MRERSSCDAENRSGRLNIKGCPFGGADQLIDHSQVVTAPSTKGSHAKFSA